MVPTPLKSSHLRLFLMRKLFDVQRSIGSTPIEEIALDITSRDDIILCLYALQALYMDSRAWQKLMVALRRVFPKGHRMDLGRPGMTSWQSFVLGVLKQVINCDYDRLAVLANGLLQLRQMLGLPDDSTKTFNRQTIQDNVSQFTPEVLLEINDEVIGYGHRILGKKEGEPLLGRCDSKVVPNNVHFPTDVNLVLDSVRGALRECAKTAEAVGLPGWRQHAYLFHTVYRVYQKIRTARRYHSNPEAVEAFLTLCELRGEKVAAFLKQLCTLKEELEEKREAGILSRAEQKILRILAGAIGKIARLLAFLLKFMDQVRRRILNGETIPQEEKVFSIHKPTRWIAKGKLGKPCELGFPVAIVEDQHQFILGHAILWEGTDKDVAVPLIKAVMARYPDLNTCSFDQGFYSPEVLAELDELLEMNAMPKKGKLTKAEKTRRQDPAFQRARQRHPGVESAMNNLNHRGLDLVREPSVEGYERVVATSILAANIHRLGAIIRERQHRKEKRRQHKLAA